MKKSICIFLCLFLSEMIFAQNEKQFIAWDGYEYQNVQNLADQQLGEHLINSFNSDFLRKIQELSKGNLLFEITPTYAPFQLGDDLDVLYRLSGRIKPLGSGIYNITTYLYLNEENRFRDVGNHCSFDIRIGSISNVIEEHAATKYNYLIEQIDAQLLSKQAAQARREQERLDREWAQAEREWQAQQARETERRKQQEALARVLPNGLNFTTSRKIGAGFLNIPLGIGSFTMGDIPGGLIVGGLEAVGVALLIIGIDSFYFSETSINGFVTEYEEGYEHEWAIYVGIGAFVGGVVYGFIRPFLYDTALAKKNGTYVASSNPLDNIDIDIIPGRHGIEQVSMSYTFRF